MLSELVGGLVAIAAHVPILAALQANKMKFGRMLLLLSFSRNSVISGQKLLLMKVHAVSRTCTAS